MGWESNLYCNISFNRKTYNSRYDVERDLEDVKSRIDIAKKELQSLAYMTEPNKFCGEDTPEEYVENKLINALSTLQEESIEEYRLELLLDNWNICHNDKGEAISLIDKELSKEDVKKFWLSKLAFFDGDFVNSDVKRKEL